MQIFEDTIKDTISFIRGTYFVDRVRKGAFENERKPFESDDSGDLESGDGSGNAGTTYAGNACSPSSLPLSSQTMFPDISRISGLQLQGQPPILNDKRMDPLLKSTSATRPEKYNSGGFEGCQLSVADEDG